MNRSIRAASRLALAVSLAVCAAPALAKPAAKETPKWDVSAPPGMTVRQVPIAVEEGTWMNIDVSPDGQTIAFDLLGDIYTMPITGGTPTRIAEGLAYETQPRFSPDGKRISFTSDRGGGDNIWIMNRDGSDKRQLTTENFRLTNQATWSPDGQFIAAKKHFTTQRSLGTGEVWLYHVSGGDGVVLIKKPSEAHQKELGEPTFAPDGKHIYFTRNTTPGPIFQYAQDSNNQIFAIERYDMETGESEQVAGGEGGAVRPAPSPDGKKLAYVRREHTHSRLYVRDLATGEDRKVYDALDQDVQETWAVTGVYPNMAWTPDSASVVFWAGGKINRVDLATGKASVIPFRIADSRGVIDPPRPPVAVAPDTFETKMPRGAAVSPDGSRVVFETLGQLWIKPMAGGTARRLTGDEQAMEGYPAWSPDGRTIAYVRWTDAGLGEVRTMSADGGASVAVTSAPGHYARPRFSPDGKTIVFERQQGGFLVSPRGSAEPGIYRVPASGGAMVRISKDGAHPQFGASSDRVFVVEQGADKASLISMDMNGEARRTHAEGGLATDFSVSPDGKFLAFKQNYQAFVAPMLPGTQDVSLSPKGSGLPVTRASGDGADWIHWSGDGKWLYWSLGPTLFGADRAAMFADAPGAKAVKYTAPATGVSLSMTVQADKPSGSVAIVGARVVTMKGPDGGAIDDGVVLIEGNRIKAVGKRGEVTIPPGTPTLDATGKTVIPGLIDAHAHGPYGVDEMTPQANWAEMVNLALGVTTRHDPSSSAATVFPALEMVRAGKLIGPRSFSTAEIVYGAKLPGLYAEIDGPEDALNHVRRLKAEGAHSIKNYNQPRREQRQQVTAAAIKEGMRSVAEGGSLFGFDMTLIADGNTTVEHNLPVGVMYEDVLQFFSESKTGYTPTLVVTYGGPAGDPYWRSHTEVWKHPLLQKHEPSAVLVAASARRELAPEEDYRDADNAREAAKLARRGVPVAIGAHGQEPGIAAHWELWSFVRGGMTPIEALRAGTIESARSLGYDRDIGSLEPGKLADLVVLDADPTQNIRNSDKVSKVMVGGHLYDAGTLNEELTGNRKRPAYWWEGNEDKGGWSGPSGGASAQTDADDG
ncbi:MAG: PD40 domain-containing protein [Novosphingobium sp.]|uniref:amidohydrolase family protein n=1 Tax=Novosphingobium sp. TaxID=1874826 RepID=UPI001D9FAEBB|nr:amidohydrolase family protein [Novosphingobium sp.]MCB2056357.1 PD40 domain-containing protein [Novosphingobium sp.]MCP5385334.1 PD40 domain-containing protein [Novosphingobium sp.]